MKLAQGINFDPLIDATIPKISGSSVGDIIGELLPYIFTLAGFILLGYLIIGGYEILVSQSDPKKIASGNQKIVNAIVGFIIVFAAYWIIQIVAEVLDLERVKNLFG